MRKDCSTLTGSLGEYELVERLSRGGMAEVFRAKRTGIHGFERTVAVKRMLPELASDPLFVSMFVDEARITAQLAHPNIVRTLDLGLSNGQYFIVLEYIDGIDVCAMLARGRQRGLRMPRRHACRIAAEVCAGLSYAHNASFAGRAQNIVHRDVSPPNVLVSKLGEVSLIDFGVVKATRRRAWTVAGTVKGKPSYLAPEQLTGAPSDHRADIYAAGILLWELLTGSPLFRSSSAQANLARARQAGPLRPSSVNASVPVALDRIVERALAHDPNDRYQDAAHMQDAIGEYVHCTGEHSSARALASFVARLQSNEVGPDDEPPTRAFEFASRPRRARVATGTPVPQPRLARATNRHVVRRATQEPPRRPSRDMWRAIGNDEPTLPVSGSR